MHRILTALFNIHQTVTGWLDRFVAGSGVTDRNYLDDPYPEYARLRERGPVLRRYALGGWYVSGFEEVTEVLLDNRFGVDPRKSPWFRRLVAIATKGEPRAYFLECPPMLNTDPPEHARLRRLARNGFLKKYVESLESNIRQIAQECLESVRQESRFDLIETLAQPLPACLIADLLGAPREDRERIQNWSEALATDARTFDIPTIRQSNRVYNELREYLISLVEYKRNHPGEDLLTQLIIAEESGDQLSEEELLATAGLLLIAGHETTTRLIGNLVYLLLTHPEQMAALGANPNLLPNAIEEALRFEPPVQHTTRIALEDIDFHGHRIKKNQLIDVSIGAANRDPAANPDPDLFDMYREDRKHVSFGHGIHLCLGAQLARLEAKVVIELLLQEFSDMQLCEGDPAWGQSDFVRGHTRLLIDVERAARTSVGEYLAL